MKLYCVCTRQLALAGRQKRNKSLMIVCYCARCVWHCWLINCDGMREQANFGSAHSSHPLLSNHEQTSAFLSSYHASDISRVVCLTFCDNKKMILRLSRIIFCLRLLETLSTPLDCFQVNRLLMQIKTRRKTNKRYQKQLDHESIQ